MAIVDSLIPEFDHEMATTRKVLERVPEERFDWKPHEKSFSLGVLATHVATLPTWGTETLTRSEIDLVGNNPPAAARFEERRCWPHSTGTSRMPARRLPERPIPS